MYDNRFDKTVKLIKDAVDTKAIPSAAIAIGMKDKVFVKETYGYTSFTSDAVKVNEETLYDMASVTKIMATTMIALKFIENGLLDLADKLYLYFDNQIPEDKKDITIFHLMTHTSGLTSHLLLEEFTNKKEDAIRIILQSTLKSPIGQIVNYSCLGFILLGKVLEFISDKPLNELANEYVFKPLRMDSTSYHPVTNPCTSSIYHTNTAYTERNPKTGEWLVGVVHDENARFLGGISGNAGVFSTINDCIHYATMLACGGKINNRRYLSEITLQSAIKNYTIGQEQQRGLGFHLAGGYDSYSGAIFDQTAYGHTGFTGPHILISPTTGLYVILLTNRVHPSRDNTAHLRLRRVLHNTIAAIV